MAPVVGPSMVTKKPSRRRSPGKRQAESFEVELRFAPRVIAEHLGKQKFATTTKAIGELVANAFDAGAMLVDIDVEENELGGIESITVVDNGEGMTRQVIHERFGMIGVETERSESSSRLGRFGVGRLGVYRIGSVSKWTTVAAAPDGTKHRLTFTLREDAPSSFSVEDEIVGEDEPAGTSVKVVNIFDTGAERPTQSRVVWDVAAQFCSYLLGNSDRKIRVNGDVLDLDRIVESREAESLSAAEYDLPRDAILTHLLLKMAVEVSRFPAQLLFATKGITVQTGRIEDPPSPNYLGIVESPYLDESVASSRDAFVLLDSGFANLTNAVKERIKSYAHRLRIEQKDRFIERVRQMKHYPFRTTPADAVTMVEQTLFDRVIELLHVSTNLENLSQKQQEMVFGLLHRSLGNEHLLEVLDRVATLGDEEMRDFREVLERTTLQSIIRLASEATDRLVFLDVLHDLVYGEDARHLRERSQLHKILEPNCWIFGPQFHLATSDKSFREVIRKHRELAGLETADEVDIARVNGVADIPDLFLAAARDYPLPAPEKAHHHVIIELKRPTVRVGMKEVQQVTRYGTTLSQSQQFDRNSTQWDVFVVSTHVQPEVDVLRKQKNRPEGCFSDSEGLRMWAYGQETHAAAR